MHSVLKLMDGDYHDHLVQKNPYADIPYKECCDEGLRLFKLLKKSKSVFFVDKHNSYKENCWFLSEII